MTVIEDGFTRQKKPQESNNHLFIFIFHDSVRVISNQADLDTDKHEE
jgi:hypothetical protein